MKRKHVHYFLVADGPKNTEFTLSTYKIIQLNLRLKVKCHQPGQSSITLDKVRNFDSTQLVLASHKK